MKATTTLVAMSPELFGFYLEPVPEEAFFGV
jgi:hypothetical protein